MDIRPSRPSGFNMDSEPDARSDSSKKSKKRLTIIASVAAIAIVAVAASAVIYDLNGDSLDLSGRQALLIVSSSMDGDVHEYAVDSFPAHSMAMARNLSESEKKEISVGDVILFRLGSLKVTHRVIDTSHIDEGYVTTKGDASETTEKVYFTAVEGEVVGTSHWLGETAMFVRANFFWILGLIFAFIIADIFISAYLKDKTSKEIEK